ncbi:D-alanyl-D-alanine carboxypeptidase DacF precursor [Paraliobacillus sp. PM-2]|uniref:D-alanyl-D-alanine carboxypeptidase family protein n=1 Tax=Paraliobacillus sp. PM-2 TaxID=1462524 RepID=UPI00061C6ADE|nr:D-alanyl-D-alanine carboxypeptidase family protein [Paraliobacillus sp. PM-2]CQR46746.1 D-alanyl-D-alanine carboxypeptidase DacF precursor [Paraliobacillus sp. PM-2]
MKKIMSSLFVLLITLLSIQTVHANENNTNDLSLAESSSSAILIERDSGGIMYEKNAHEQLPPASMTKMMTLLLIMEALDQEKITLDEKIRISEHAASMGGSQIFLEEGEEMSVDDLLKGIAIASGNDASVALAERIAGSEAAFVTMMNEKVKDLGLENTLFQNPTGLPADDHYSTAYDMAVIAKELLKYEKITNYTKIYEDYLRKGTDDEFWLVNTNKLVKFYQGVDGLKTGYTSEAKYCLTATAKKDNMRVIAVAMGAESPKKRNKAITQMLDYAFSQYKTELLYQKDQPVTQISMVKADKNKVNVITGDSISVLLEKGMDKSGIETIVKIDQNISLPLKKGSKVGLLQVKHNGKLITETPLLLEESIQKASVWKLFKFSMKELVKN